MANRNSVFGFLSDPFGRNERAERQRDEQRSQADMARSIAEAQALNRLRPAPGVTQQGTAEGKSILGQDQRTAVGADLMNQLQGGANSLFNSLMEQGNLANQANREQAFDQLKGLHSRRFSGGGESGLAGATMQQSGDLQAQMAREDALREAQARSQALGYHQQLLDQALGAGQQGVQNELLGMRGDQGLRDLMAQYTSSFGNARANTYENRGQQDYTANMTQPNFLQDLSGFFIDQALLGGNPLSRITGGNR